MHNKFIYGVTHHGTAHLDDFLSSCFLLALNDSTFKIYRRDPTDEELQNKLIAVFDIGLQHNPDLSNFDHHQFDSSYGKCAFSLILEHYNVYDTAKTSFPWLDYVEYFDVNGHFKLSSKIGIDPKDFLKLKSPVEDFCLKLFQQQNVIQQGDFLYDLMFKFGEYLFDYITKYNLRMKVLENNIKIFNLNDNEYLAYLPDSLDYKNDPEFCLFAYLEKLSQEKNIIFPMVIVPNNRQKGIKMIRVNDNVKVDFNKYQNKENIFFCHKNGFLLVPINFDIMNLIDIFEQSYSASITNKNLAEELLTEII